MGRGGIFSFSYNIRELYFKRYVYIACLIKRTTIDKDVKHKKMKTNETCKLKLLTIILGFVTACVMVLIGAAAIVPTDKARAADTVIDTLEVSFKRAGVGEGLVGVFDFEDETAKTLKTPSGANYTATLEAVFRNGQKQTLWTKGSSSFPWSRVENQLVEHKVAYCIRVAFTPKTGYTLSSNQEVIKKKLKVSGAELGKGKDIELWDTAGRNSITTAIQMDFIISKGMTYVGYEYSVQPVIGVQITGKLCTPYADTGIWIRGAEGPYTYSVKDAPIGMDELLASGGYDESICNYRITAVNAMDGGTIYVTVRAADGQTCEIPLRIEKTEGGHEHKWSDFGKIDYEHHGYRRCDDPDCPGVCVALDKGSQYARHDFYGDCNASCKTCGELINPDAKHAFSVSPDETDDTCHVYKCVCGEVKKDASGNVVKEKHGGGVQTCTSGAKCEECGHEYLAKTGHKYEFRSFKNNDGTYMHLGFCKYCGKENVDLRHTPSGGTATCQTRAKCTYEYEGDVCGCVYGEFKAHVFVGGRCTECSSDEYIKEVVIDVPEYYKGMAYEPLFYSQVLKGNVVDLGIYYYKASLGRDANHYLCGSHNFRTTYITENSIMLYAFNPQTNCKFPESVDEISVSVTHGEVFDKQIRETDGALVVLVLLRVDDVVQSIDLEVSQPITGNSSETLKISEKNGYELNIKSIGPTDDGKFITNTPIEINLIIKAPKGKAFQDVSKVSLENWLCDFSLSGAKILIYKINKELTELELTVQTPRSIDCPHEAVTMKEIGRSETCDEDGVKDKYACTVCGKEFFDAACTAPWNDASAVIPKSHLALRHEATACSAGRDGNAEYYECRREGCGKFFEDAACLKEITLADTIIHDFKTELSANEHKHYHECKNCAVINGEAAHRPDRAEATEDEAVVCLDCGYIIEPALAHTHKTTLVPQEPATCKKEGRKAYYKCNGCEIKFEDEAATKPVTDANALVIAKSHKFGALIAEVSATENTTGVKAHKDCEFCDKHFDEDGNEIFDLTIPKQVKTEVVVEGGTGGGRLIVGDTVTVVANKAGKGKKFVGWVDDKGNVVSTDAEYTFVVSDGISLFARYEDVKKKGLSGGAIAGITVGGVAVVGIGGLAVYLFVVKKKTISEVLALIKGVFTKK